MHGGGIVLQDAKLVYEGPSLDWVSLQINSAYPGLTSGKVRHTLFVTHPTFEREWGTSVIIVPINYVVRSCVMSPC